MDQTLAQGNAHRVAGLFRHIATIGIAGALAGLLVGGGGRLLMLPRQPPTMV